MKNKKLRKLQYLCGTEERFRDLMLLIDADNNAHAADHCMPRQVELILQRTEAMKAEGSAMFGYKLPLTGKDVMEIKGHRAWPPSQGVPGLPAEAGLCQSSERQGRNDKTLERIP